MTIVTGDRLRKLAPNLGPLADKYADLLSAAMERFGIDTTQRAAYFLGQLMVESGQLHDFRENMNYSAAGLLKTWPSRFKNLVDAQFYERQPAKIANYVYANRMGNGDEKSGDGWKHRGAGWIQLTGKTNQTECARELAVISDIGDWLASPNGAALSAAWFWWKSGCNRYADMGNIDAVSDLINIGRRTAKEGDSIGFTKRADMTNLALKVFA